MVKITAKIKDSLMNVKHLYLATASKDGTPNVIIVGAWKLMDDESVLISDQFFLKTFKNLQENPKVSFAFWGDKGGYQIKGMASIHKDDKVFADDIEFMKVKYPKLTPKSAVLVKFTEVYVLKGGPDAGKKIL